MRIKMIIMILIVFILGFLAGGILFRNKVPGIPLSIKDCHNCFRTSQISAILTSLILKNVPGIIPNVILETDKTIVIENPFSEHKIHYIFFPKKDIKDVGSLTEGDKEYIIDLYASIAEVIKMKNIKKYKIMSNGTGRQNIAYLHFHLIVD